MSKCGNCGSQAINPGYNGRDSNTDLDLCDVCYWKKQRDLYKRLAEDLRCIMKGQPGNGDFSREQRTLADYERLMKL